MRNLHLQIDVSFMNSTCVMVTISASATIAQTLEQSLNLIGLTQTVASVHLISQTGYRGALQETNRQRQRRESAQQRPSKDLRCSGKSTGNDTRPLASDRPAVPWMNKVSKSPSKIHPFSKQTTKF